MRYNKDMKHKEIFTKWFKIPTAIERTTQKGNDEPIKQSGNI